jgi:hypothetical protein
MDWLPIEAAPKDGTEILIWYGERAVVARWEDSTEAWVDDEWRRYPATAWMPLPAPPVTPSAPPRATLPASADSSR